MDEIVINTEHGGFGIDNEIRQWLIKNKSWDPFKVRNRWSIEFRSDPRFVECVKTLHSELKKQFPNANDRYKQRKKHKVLDLTVANLSLSVGVEDVNDGIEEVVVDWNAEPMVNWSHQ